MNFCRDLKESLTEYEGEVNEHKIREKKDRIVRKMKQKKYNKRRRQKLERKLGEYTKHLRGLAGLRAAHNKLCGEKKKLSCKEVEIARAVWEEEIRKFLPMIIVSGKRKKYDRILSVTSEAVKRCNQDFQ